MLETLFTIDDLIPFLYLAICIISVGHFKMTTSLSITAIALTLSELFQRLIRDPLWHYLPTIDADNGRMLWYGTWVSIYMTTVVCLHKVHVWKNIAIAKEAVTIGWSLTLLSLLMLIRYISAISVQSEFYATFYQFAIPSINMGMGLYLIYSTVVNIYDINIRTRVRRLPR